MFDQRGIADRFLEPGQDGQFGGFGWVRLDVSDFPTRHAYGVGLAQRHIERVLADWATGLGVRIQYGTEVAGFTQDESGVDVDLTDGRTLRRALPGRLRRRQQPDPQERRHRASPAGTPLSAA